MVGGFVRVCESLQEEEDKVEQQICSIIAVAKKTTSVIPAADEVVDLQIPKSSCCCCCCCCCGCWCAKFFCFFFFLSNVLSVEISRDFSLTNFLSAPRSSACVFSFSFGFLLFLLHPAPPPCPHTPDRFSPPPWTLSRKPTHHVYIRVARPVTEHLSAQRKRTANLVFSSSYSSNTF